MKIEARRLLVRVRLVGRKVSVFENAIIDTGATASNPSHLILSTCLLKRILRACGMVLNGCLKLDRSSVKDES